MSNAAIAASEGSHPKAPPQDKEMTGVGRDLFLNSAPLNVPVVRKRGIGGETAHSSNPRWLQN